MRHRGRGILVLALAIVIAGSLFGETKAAGKKIVVGVTLQDLSNEWIAMCKDALVKRQKELYPDVQLIINDAQGDAAKQDAQMNSFISQKVNAIINDPRDANACIPSIKAAVKARIPVITLSADAAEDVGQVWCGAANPYGGHIEMQWVVDKLGGKGNVAILRGPIGAVAEIGRYQGYKEVLDKYPNVKVVFDQTGNWSREEGLSIMENWLQTGTEIDAVVAQNDEMALGALKAVEDAGKKSQTVVAGLDAIPDALRAVQSGRLDLTVFQDAIGQAYGSLDLAVKAARGQKIQKTDIPFELVTKDNVASYWDRIKLK